MKNPFLLFPTIDQPLTDFKKRGGGSEGRETTE